MSETINVALLGLGRIGQQFADSLAKHIKEKNKPIRIVAVAEQNPDSEAAKRFSDDGVPVHTNASGIVELGDQVDIIFDLTGVPSVRQEVHDKLNRIQ
jgi:homoserine dehydrogenase